MGLFLNVVNVMFFFILHFVYFSAQPIYTGQLPQSTHVMGWVNINETNILK